MRKPPDKHAQETLDADLLIHARWIAPVEPLQTLLEDHALIVRSGCILELLPAAEAKRKYQARECLRLDHHLLLPGLINAHTHAAMNLLRGIADDLPMRRWLEEYIWPTERRFVDADFVRAGTYLAAVEMIRCGTTCFSDMYFFPDAAIQIARQAGLRIVAGLPVIDFPTPWSRDAAECLQLAQRLHEDHDGGGDLVSFTLAPHAPYSVCDETLEQCRTLAERLSLSVHIHMHETAQEISESLRQHGCRPLQRLQQLGLLERDLIAVHMTQVEPPDVELLLEHGVQVVHCPESNLKLASGLCPVQMLHQAGVNVALGTDGAASNNDLNLPAEMRCASLLAKLAAGQSSALSARQTLRMATLQGARALGLGEKLGSLEPGKQADLIAVDLDHPETQPVYDPISQFVYSADRSQISEVWVAGRPLLRERRLLTLDAAQAVTQAQSWRRRISAALTVPSSEPG